MVETRLGRYNAAMAGILRANFPAQPQERECPRCPHYFICTGTEEA
jgi:DNA helicase II / ATP-dependent DNA helicase PcrA